MTLLWIGAAAQADPPAEARRLPKAGITKVGAQVFTLSTTDIENKLPGGFCGSFGRELIRQSLLVTARDEFGLATLDASIGEITFVSESPETYPYQLDVRFTHVPDDNTQFAVDLELSLPDASGKWRSWSNTTLRLPVENRLDALAEQFEILSRETFTKALKELGFSPAVNEKRPATEKAQTIEEHLDFVTQFSVLRQLHAQRRNQPESPENLGALSRAYANLGHLVDFHWSAASKAFKARSTIYAQRLLAKYGKTPFGLSHRAYARALTGNHVKALEDIETAKTADGLAAPDWLKLIEAYCKYQPEILEGTTGPDNELALYLRMRLVDPHFDKDSGLAAIEAFMKVTPASCRAVELICDMRAVGLTRSVTEGGADRMWPGIYRQLLAIPQLPEGARLIAERHKEEPDKLADPADEHRARVEMIEQLRQASQKNSDQSEPSWQALADLAYDASFIQAWRVVDCENTLLGMKSDISIDALAPLVEKHRLGPCLRVYSTDRERGRAAMTDLVKVADSTSVELPAAPFTVWAHRVNPDFYNRVATELIRHRDILFEDLLRSGSSNIPDLYNDAFKRISEVAPYQPRSIAWEIQMSGDFPQKSAEEWEAKYGNNAQLMLFLGQKHRRWHHPDDAERCLKKSIEITPTYEAHFALADEYRDRDEMKACQATLEQSLELPSYSLEYWNAQSQIAYILMNKGEWKAAQPHALAAAESYSGWGLIAAATCAEGLKQWTVAEQYYRAVSERYDGSADNWYHFCLRRGRGNIKGARAFTEQTWKAAKPPLRSDQIWSRAIGDIADGNLKKAQEMLVDATNKRAPDEYSLILAAILADKLKDTAARDGYFQEIETRFNPTHPMPILVHFFRRALHQPDPYPWNRESFDELIDFSSIGNAAYAYLFAGLFLENRGQSELARTYLEAAATSGNIHHYPCVLSNMALRQKKVKVGTTRLYARPDSWIPSRKAFDAGKRTWREGKLDEAHEHFTEAIRLRPAFVIALIERARLSRFRGDFAAAIKDYEEILRINPDCEKGHLYLASVLSNCNDDKIRNGPEALKHAEQAYEARITKTYICCATLAAAHAECGHFDKAVEFQEAAVKLAPQIKGQEKLLAEYREGKPHRFVQKKESSPKNDAEAEPTSDAEPDSDPE